MQLDNQFQYKQNLDSQVNQNIVLLDYKTDKVNEDTIKDRAEKYFYQLSAYKKGLEAITEKTVTDAYICFLSCGKNVSLDEISKT